MSRALGRSVLFLAHDLAGIRVDLQFDVLAGRIIGLGVPDSVLVVDIVHVGVAGCGQLGTHVGLGQVGDQFVGTHGAGLGIDADIHAVAVGAARVRLPHAV